VVGGLGEAVERDGLHVDDAGLRTLTPDRLVVRDFGVLEALQGANGHGW
jgi:hypothetical protein